MGYLWLGYAKLSSAVASTPMHMITLAALLGGVLMVWLTTGLWHSGFNRLDYSKVCSVLVPILLVATLVRTVLMQLVPQWLLMHVRAVLVAIVFFVYLWAFVPLFCQRAFTAESE